MVKFIFCIAVLVGQYLVFQKMGRQGWEGIVPFYNSYVLFQELYGDGWKFLTLLIPFYNIYVMIRADIDWAHAFNQPTAFGVGMCFLSPVFLLILAFTDVQYVGTGYSSANPVTPNYSDPSANVVEGYDDNSGVDLNK